MGSFFHGWRRKAGVVTLMIALAIMAMWLRSRLVEDVVAYSLFGRRHVIATYSGKIVGWSWNESATKDLVDPFNFIDDVPQPWDVKRAGEIERLAPNLISHREIAYWSITLPLTIISAYLILWKPRKRKPKSPPHF